MTAYRAAILVDRTAPVSEVVLTEPEDSGLPDADLLAIARHMLAQIGEERFAGNLEVGLWEDGIIDIEEDNQ